MSFSFLNDEIWMIFEWDRKIQISNLSWVFSHKYANDIDQNAPIIQKYCSCCCLLDSCPFFREKFAQILQKLAKFKRIDLHLGSLKTKSTGTASLFNGSRSITAYSFDSDLLATFRQFSANWPRLARISSIVRCGLYLFLLTNLFCLGP